VSLPHNEPAQINRTAGAEREKLVPKTNLKERAKDQIRNFTLMFVYLWVVFGMLVVHESIVLAQHQIDYRFHGLAVMLVAEDLHLGHGLNGKPLIYPILFKSFLFGVTLICFHIVEHVLIGLWDGKPIARSILEIGADKLAGIVSLGIIATVALVPFFILREISRVLGYDKFWALFFHRTEL
jgi:hypothetical protein